MDIAKITVDYMRTIVGHQQLKRLYELCEEKYD